MPEDPEGLFARPLGRVLFDDHSHGIVYELYGCNSYIDSLDSFTSSVDSIELFIDALMLLKEYNLTIADPVQFVETSVLIDHETNHPLLLGCHLIVKESQQTLSEDQIINMASLYGERIGLDQTVLDKVKASRTINHLKVVLKKAAELELESGDHEHMKQTHHNHKGRKHHGKKRH